MDYAALQDHRLQVVLLNGEGARATSGGGGSRGVVPPVGRTSRNANRTSHPSHTRARGAGDAFEADVFAWDAQFKSVVFRRQPQHTFQKADYRVVPVAAIKDAKVRVCMRARVCTARRSTRVRARRHCRRACLQARQRTPPPRRV